MAQIKHTLLTRRELQKAMKIRGFIGRIASGCAMRILGITKMNKVYSKTYDKDCEVFLNNWLEYGNNELVIPENDLHNIPETGPVVFFFNHPYGGLDALVIMKTLLKVRPDTKFIGNFLLSRVEPTAHLLFKVNPFETHKDAFSSYSGLREMTQHIREGKCVCILPAGEVSTKYGKSKIVEDREWQLNIMKYAKNANAPVISGYVDGENSRFFHIIGKIHPLLRTLRLPRELLNKKNLKVNLRFSGATSAKSIQNISDLKILEKVLKAKTYCLENESYSTINVTKSEQGYKDIIDATPIEKLLVDIESIKETSLLFKSENYLCFFAKHDQIPNIFREISRLREITFREIGEGTGKEFDSDQYDLYYNHLFLWDEKDNKVVGAYRIGLGTEIFQEKGINGFYINTLFKFEQEFYSIIEKSMEMGRSFIVHDYQKRTMPLFLLWKGIYFATQKHPEYKYLIGPASISNLYSKHAKILIIEYLKRHHSDEDMSILIKNRIPIKYKLTKHHQILLDVFGNDLSTFDRLIKDIDINKFSMPILIKKYLSLGGKILEFNLDPDFNNAIDGFVVLDIAKVSEEVIKTYNK